MVTTVVSLHLTITSPSSSLEKMPLDDFSAWQILTSSKFNESNTKQIEA